MKTWQWVILGILLYVAWPFLFYNSTVSADGSVSTVQGDGTVDTDGS